MKFDKRIWYGGIGPAKINKCVLVVVFGKSAFFKHSVVQVK